jgi:predicted nuclease of predicted toxin-antitoxin system
MKIVADEGVESRIVYSLRNAGFEVLYIAEEYRAIKDIEVLTLANQEKAILLTKDKDFGELVYKNKYPYYGILMYRFNEGMSSVEKALLLLQAFHTYGIQFENAFTVIDENFIRIRPQKQ